MATDSFTPVKVHTFKAFDLPLSTVTVFSDRAEVKRIVNVELEAGINEIIIEAVAQSTVTDSIRVDGRGKAVIHEVQFQCKPSLSSETISPRVKVMEDELKDLLEKKSAAEDEQKVILKQVEALDELILKVTSSLVNPPQTEIAFTLNETTFESIQKLMEFHETNSVRTRKQSREVAAKIKAYEESINKLNAELERTRNDRSVSRNISILLETEEKAPAELTVSYQVWGASWVPTYDIRVSAAEYDKGLMNISYFGKIQQNSGEDWNEAKLILSTAQPALGGNLPMLGTLEARFGQMKQQFDPIRCYEGSQIMSCMAAPRLGNAVASVSTIGVGDTVMATAFEITRPTNIPSDSSEHRVTIAVVDLHPTLVYTAVPSKSTNVFLIASLVNDSAYPLLAGEAAVYFENSFIAKTNLKSVSPGEPFSCSLGVDPAIKVEYKPLHKFTEQVGLITKNPCVGHEQKILLKNTKKDKVVVTVKEAIPKSTDEKIKIRLTHPQVTLAVENSTQKIQQKPPLGAVLNKQNHLEWTVSLGPNEELELLIRFAVEHPSSETVVFEEAF